MTENPSPAAKRQGLFASARRTLQRFPGVLASAALGTGIVIQSIFRQGETDLEKVAYWKLLWTAVLGISWLYSLSLIAERRWPEPKRTWIPLLVGFFTLGLYYFRLTFLNEATLSDAFLFESIGLFLGLHFFAAYAPFLGYRQPRSFWEYNRRIFIRFLMALLFSGTLYLGTMLFFAALTQVTAFPFLEILFVIMAALIIGMFNTWFFLAGVPQDFESLEQSPPPYPRGLRIFAQYVLMPLVIAIGLVLEIWLLQRILGGKKVDTPSIVAFFTLGGFGLLTYLLLYPLRAESNLRWLRIFEKGFFLGLIPLMASIVYAAFRLIQIHGWTPLRYYALALSLWGLGLSLYFLISKKPGIRWIPVSLSLIAFLTMAGPQGPYEVSRRSQSAGLGVLLSKAGIEARPSPTEALLSLPAETKNNILAQVSYLDSHYGCDSLRPFFGARLDGSGANPPPCDLRNLRNILQRDPSLPPEKFSEAEPVAINFLAENPPSPEISVRGFDMYFPSDAIRFLEGGRPSSECPQGPSESPVCAVLPQEGQKMELFLRGKPLGSVDLGPIYQGLMSRHYKKSEEGSTESFYLKPEQLTFDENLPAGKLRLNFGQIRLEKKGEQIYPDYVRFSLLFKEGR